VKDGFRYVGPDGKRGVYNEEQNEAAKAALDKEQHICSEHAEDVGCCDKYNEYKCTVCGRTWTDESADQPPTP